MLLRPSVEEAKRQLHMAQPLPQARKIPMTVTADTVHIIEGGNNYVV